MAPPPGFAIATVASDAAEADAILTPTEALAQTLATAVSATMASAASTTDTGNAQEGIEPPSPGGECRLLGSFALLVQLALGALALLSLVYKRWRERPQRPLKIWFFDVSKQVFGSVLVHVANVFMSMLTSGRFSVQVEPADASNARRWLLMGRDEDYTPNPCSFYLLNLAIDTTIGIPILIGLLKLCTMLVSYTPFGKPAESIQSGNYGSPPNAWWWLKQSVIYFVGLFGMKIVVLIIFLVFPWISRVGDWALGWTEGNEQLQIFFVMMFFPLIMNALQYYVIDSFIKKPEGDHARVPEEDPDWAVGTSGSNPYDDAGLFSSDDEDDDASDSSEEARLRSRKGVQVQVQAQPERKQNTQQAEYDPELDGDAPTVVGSSASRKGEARTDLPTELYPKE